jgi:hypothetical protein
MRRVALAWLVGAGLAGATTAWAEARAGAWAGVNFATLEIEDLAAGDRQSRTTAGVGALLAWRFADVWSLELRPGYVGRGAEVRIAGRPVAIEAALVEVPLVATRDLGRGTLRPYLLAGFAMGFQSSAEVVLGSTRQDISGDFQDTDASLRAGGGLRLSRVAGQPFVEVEYTHGLTDVNASRSGLGSDVGAIRNRGVQVRGGISFGIGVK